MNLKLSKGQLHSSRIEAISSKSYVHRLLIAAALSDNCVTINTNIISKDMEATVGVLRSLGASVFVSDQSFTVRKAVSLRKEVTLDCNESGSTARFIMPIAAFFASKTTMTGRGKLPERPFTELIDVLSEHGISFDGSRLPLSFGGKLRGGDYSIAGNVSSQYITGLLFILPLLEESSTLTVTTELTSSGYVDMTLDVLNTFGIVIKREGNVFHIPGGQKYHGPECITAEGDWSNGAYLLSFAHVANLINPDVRIEITGLNKDSLQKDRAISDVLSKLSSTGQAIDVDCSEIPDIVPALAVVGAFYEKPCVLRNVERLRIKESDRIASTSKLLEAIGVDCVVSESEGHETMTVFGKGKSLSEASNHGIIIDSFNDHRVVMAAAVLSLVSDEGVIINDALAINKSYPGFFEMLRDKLGMLIEEM